MRVGIDARSLYRRDMKGIGTYLENLLPALARLDGTQEYFLYHDGRQDTVDRTPPGASFRQRRISAQTGDRYYFWEQLRLPAQVRWDGIELMHSVANTTPALKGCPTVVTIHDTKLFEARRARPLARLYTRCLQPFALRRADRIICPSEFTKRCVVETLAIAPERVEVVPLAVGERFRVLGAAASIEGVRARYELRRGFILSVGGESPVKNNSRLLSAFARLRERGRIDQQLVITGIRSKSILEAHLAEVKRHAMERDVVILGYVDEADLVSLYNAADAFVYPSLFEGFGFPPLEAMACGVPVAASDATSIPEVVGDAALLFDGRDVARIAEQAERLVTDRELAGELRKKGFEQVKRFSWEETARRTLRVYEEVMRSPIASFRRPRAR
jgi:glycosyltransferase involved in cell wall biosynthesis